MKNELYKLLVEYEDIILSHSMKMRWLLKCKHKSVAYRMAVWNSVHEDTLKLLERAHEHLLSLDNITHDCG